jgi:hypothetical protein
MFIWPEQTAEGELLVALLARDGRAAADRARRATFDRVSTAYKKPDAIKEEPKGSSQHWFPLVCTKFRSLGLRLKISRPIWSIDVRMGRMRRL